jgi:hypothetical protein
MFYEQISVYTKKHLLEHLKSYLDAEAALYSDRLPLVLPVAIDLSSLVGGVIATARDTLPQYTIDCNTKAYGEEIEDLQTYLYSGAITFLVGGQNADIADHLAHRHAAALEKWVRDHVHMHQHDDDDGFTILGFAWVATQFTGAVQVETQENTSNSQNDFWVCAGAMEVQWVTSESGPGDHA